MEIPPAGAGDHAISVIIAEPHRTVGEALARAVSASGYARVDAVAASSDDILSVAQRLSPDVAIIDLDLSPDCRLVSGLAEISPKTRVIVLGDRGSAGAEPLLKALRAGAVGAMFKESSFEELSRALDVSGPGTPVIAEEAAGLLLHSYVDTLQEKRERDLATIEALAAAVEARDLTTASHLRRVTSLGTRCLEAIDVDLAHNEETVYGFMLHDVGKIGVPDSILNKPGSLEQGEWAVMRRHPEIGIKIIDPLGFGSVTKDIVLSHHERWDGAGYPLGLRGEEIPVSARAFSVVDAFDAMTSDRPYREAMDPDVALATIKAEAGHAFDPEVVAVFSEVAA